MRSVGGRIALGIAFVGMAGASVRASQPESKSTLATREFDVHGYHVRVDLSKQVIAVDVPQDRGFARDHGSRDEAPISPTLVSGPEFVSASVLAQKAKQFDDGLYAAVELAAQNGAGAFAGKFSMLSALARAIATHPVERTGDADLVLLAACKLGNLHADIPQQFEPAVRSAVSEFLADELRSKPIGFYTWSDQLSSIFRQDRMLQTELKGEAGIAALARAIHGDKKVRATYEGYLTLVSRLTNQLAGRSLGGPLHTLDSGGSDFPSNGLAFFPASRAHETDLVKKLYMDRPIPDDFSLVEEMVKRIRSKTIDLTPTTASGWYDYQTWSLETLVAPERAAEAGRLKLEEAYRKQLEEVFKGILALTRETHVKQLEIPAPAREPGVSNQLSKSTSTHSSRLSRCQRFMHAGLLRTDSCDR